MSGYEISLFSFCSSTDLCSQELGWKTFDNPHFISTVTKKLPEWFNNSNPFCKLKQSE